MMVRLKFFALRLRLKPLLASSPLTLLNYATGVSIIIDEWQSLLAFPSILLCFSSPSHLDLFRLTGWLLIFSTFVQHQKLYFFLLSLWAVLFRVGSLVTGQQTLWFVCRKQCRKLTMGAATVVKRSAQSKITLFFFLGKRSQKNPQWTLKWIKLYEYKAIIASELTL